MELGFGIPLLILAVALIALILVQQGKDKKLSSSIAGGSDTFFGKGKSASDEKKLSIATAVISALFGAVVLAMFLVISF